MLKDFSNELDLMQKKLFTKSNKERNISNKRVLNMGESKNTNNSINNYSKYYTKDNVGTNKTNTSINNNHQSILYLNKEM